MQGCLDQFSDDEIDLLVGMSVAARRPINWNVLTVDARVPERVTRQLDASTQARERGRRDRGADHAGARADEHELRHALRAVPHPRMARRDEPARRRAHGEAARPRGAQGADREGPQQGSGRVQAPHLLRQVRHRRHLLAAERGAEGPRRAGRGRRARRRSRSTCSSRSCATTNCARCCGRCRPTTTPTRGSCASRCGRTTGPCSAAPTPAPTSTACAARRTRRGSSATCCAAASSCPSRRRSR